MLKKIDVVTGANQGLGHGIVQNFIEKLPKRSTVFLLGRNEKEIMKKEKELKNSNVNLIGFVVNLSKKDDINIFCNYLSKNMIKIDYFVSNASPRMSQNQNYSSEVRNFINVSNINSNYFIDSLIPYLNFDAIVSIISSSFAKKENIAKSLWKLFTVNQEISNLNQILEHYIEDVEKGKKAKKCDQNELILFQKLLNIAVLKYFHKNTNK